MKVRLLKSISGKQRVGSIIEVAEAYARNYLLPQKIAVVATAQVLSEVAHDQQRSADQQKKQADNIIKLTAQLAATKLTISRPANSKGTLFAALKLDDIVTAIAKQLHITIEPIGMEPAHIKNVGRNAVVLEVNATTKIPLTVEVTGQPT